MSSPKSRPGTSPGNGTSAIAVVIQEALGKTIRSQDDPMSEREALLLFCQEFQRERKFSQCSRSSTFVELLQLLKAHRVTAGWLEKATSDHTHSMFTCLRLLLRDDKYQHKFMNGINPIPVLAKALSQYTESHFTDSHNPAAVSDTLKELTNIFQKLSNSTSYGERLMEDGVHRTLVQLLSARDLVPLQCSLCALINLCKSPRSCDKMGELSCVSPLLYILHHYDTSSRQLASDLLLLLSQSRAIREQVRDTDGLPLCLRLLHSDNLHILHRMVGVIERLAEDSELQEEIRLLGGIPLILTLLSKRDASGGAIARESLNEKLTALRAACCSAITQLVVNDSSAQQIVQGNGIYFLSCLILPQVDMTFDPRLSENLQKHALRALRYLFSMERNRQLFKRLFPPQLFETFIDIGHYERDLSAYASLVHMVNTLPESEVGVIQSNVEATNQNKAPIFSIGNYAALELLGSGAFGSVYKVKKKNSDVFMAMKEIRATHPTLGRSVAERSTSIGKLLNEVNIMKEQLRHPNVVRYQKCFQEGGHLYIIMELLEGAPLSEHITSLQEKGLRLSEQRLWKIFTQLVLALRYIHKEKRVIHRDLTLANIMLGEGDKLTITDFGLAKQKQKEFSVMKSVVGTMLYWCPELVQSEPYNEKADIWAAGCVLYQMATLKPPFHSKNLLALAKKIAEVEYDPVPEGLYSPLVGQVIQRCLTARPEERPDSVELGSLISGVMMQHMDQLALQNESLERRLYKEKQRTIKHFNKALWTEQKYQQLLSISETANPTRRKLSTSFGSGLNHSPMVSQRLCSPDRSDTSREPKHQSPPGPSIDDADLTDGDISDTDPLQKSSDSVFVANIPDETNRLQFPAKESTPPLRENPLTSRTNSGMRMRSQSAVVVGRGDLLHTAKQPPLPALQTRSQSAYIHRLSIGTGPLSPMTRKTRTSSVSSILSIPPRHVREISDPISQLMVQLHKLVFVTQLPPSPAPSMRRLLVEHYKRTLFGRTSVPADLKTEMHKLMNRANDPVQLLMEATDEHNPRIAQRALIELAAASSSTEEVLESPEGHQTITYEQLEAIVESLLQENGYYTEPSRTSGIYY